LKKRTTLILSLLALCAVVLVAALVWNESRKEIVFLCGNFSKGVSEDSVRRQLDTGQFLTYESTRTPSGSHMEVHSKYNLSVYRCSIDFDADGEVLDARVAQGLWSHESGSE
jgi:hypothetical protein